MRAAERDGNRIGLVRKFFIGWIYADAVSAAEVLANRLQQPPLQNLAHGANGDAICLVVIKGSVEGDQRQTLGLDAFLDLFTNTSVGLRTPGAFPSPFPWSGGTAPR